MAIEAKSVEAYPTKAFFVSMITRDITLEDCIFDLIDNSVDGAWRCEGSRPMGLDQAVDLSPYSIWIEVTEKHFSIRDNCGGMSLDDAVSHAFTFGRRPSDQPDKFSIGVYGIGMKRAAFKIGRKINVRSTVREDNGNRLAFAVPINVGEWLANDAPPWDFDIVDDGALPENGVEVSISELTADTASSFGSPAFVQNLRRTIGRDYTFHLAQGLRVLVNDEAVIGWNIQLLQGDEFRPLRVEYEDETEGQRVTVEVIGGMAAPPPDDTGPAEDQEGDKRYGWYVVCNGRIVLAADKTEVAGWGTPEWPQWHGQYAGFVGVILFAAENAGALPLTTTKRSVDRTSEVFRRARPRMRDVTRSWIGYTNQRKQALDEAKEREARAAPVGLAQIAKQSAVSLPSLTARPTEKMANVNYAVSLVRMRKLAKEMGSINMPYREVGLESFNYTYSDLVGED